MTTRQRVIATVKDTPLSVAQIADKTGADPVAVRRIIPSLVKSGHLVQANITASPEGRCVAKTYHRRSDE